MPRRKKERPEKPERTLLRVMTLMDCAPGNSKRVDGPPIAILTLAHLDEIEQPMMLTLEDTRTLMVRCLECMDAHGDAFARYLLQRYYSDASNGGERPASDDDAGDGWKNP